MGLNRMTVTPNLGSVVGGLIRKPMLGKGDKGRIEHGE